MKDFIAFNCAEQITNFAWVRQSLSTGILSIGLIPIKILNANEYERYSYVLNLLYEDNKKYELKEIRILKRVIGIDFYNVDKPIKINCPLQIITENDLKQLPLFIEKQSSSHNIIYIIDWQAFVNYCYNNNIKNLLEILYILNDCKCKHKLEI